MSFTSKVISGAALNALPQTVQRIVSETMLKGVYEMINMKNDCNLTFKDAKCDISSPEAFKKRFEMIENKQEAYEFLATPINAVVPMLDVMHGITGNCIKCDGINDEFRTEMEKLNNYMRNIKNFLNEVISLIRGSGKYISSIINEKDEAIARNGKLQTENTTLKDKKDKLQTDLDAALSKNATIQAERDALKAELRLLKNDISKYQNDSDAYDSIYREFRYFKADLATIKGSPIGNALYENTINTIETLDRKCYDSKYSRVPTHKRPYAPVVVSTIKEYFKAGISKYIEDNYVNDDLYKEYMKCKKERNKDSKKKAAELYLQLQQKVPDCVKLQICLTSIADVLSSGKGSPFQEFFNIFNDEISIAEPKNKYNEYIRRLDALAMNGQMYSFIAFGPDANFNETLVGIKVGETDIHIQIQNGSPKELIYGLNERVGETYFMTPEKDGYSSLGSIIPFPYRMFGFTRSFLSKGDREAFATDLCILSETSLMNLFDQYPELHIPRSMMLSHYNCRAGLSEKMNALNEDYKLPVHECKYDTIPNIIKEVYGYNKDRIPKKGFEYNINRSDRLLQGSSKVNTPYVWKSPVKESKSDSDESSKKDSKKKSNKKVECAISKALTYENEKYNAAEVLTALYYRANIQLLYNSIAPYIPMIISTSTCTTKNYLFKSFEERDKYIKAAENKICEQSLGLYDNLLQECRINDGNVEISEVITTKFFIEKFCSGDFNGIYDELFGGSIFDTNTPEYKALMDAWNEVQRLKSSPDTKTDTDTDTEGKGKKALKEAQKEYQTAFISCMNLLPCCNATYEEQLLNAMGEKKPAMVKFFNDTLLM